jgi:hypothetical protein
MKKEKKIDVDGFVDEFCYLDNIYSEAIETLKSNQLKSIKKITKKFNINLLTQNNIDETKADILYDCRFRQKSEITEFEVIHRVTDHFCFTYCCDGIEDAKEFFPEVFNPKQSQ